MVTRERGVGVRKHAVERVNTAPAGDGTPNARTERGVCAQESDSAEHSVKQDLRPADGHCEEALLIGVGAGGQRRFLLAFCASAPGGLSSEVPARQAFTLTSAQQGQSYGWRRLLHGLKIAQHERVARLRVTLLVAPRTRCRGLL